MKSKRAKKTRSGKRQLKLLIKTRLWGSHIDEAYQLEAMLAKRPRRIQIELVGPGELPADTALLMRSMVLKRSPGTRLVTTARSSLKGATALVWLLGDVREIRDDARLVIRPAGPFVADDAPAVWRDGVLFDDDDDTLAEEDYIQVLRLIDEYLPVKELAGEPVDVPVLREFGLIESEKRDKALSIAFGGERELGNKGRGGRPRKAAKTASR